MPLTSVSLMETRTSPSLRLLHLPLSRIFLTFCPKPESAMVKPKPMPPLTMGTVISESGLFLAARAARTSPLEASRSEDWN